VVLQVKTKIIFHWFYCDWWVQAPWHAAPMQLKLLTWWLKIWRLCSSDKEKIKGEKQFPKFCFCFSAKVQEWLDAQGAFTRASYWMICSCIGRLHPQHEQQLKHSCQKIVHYFTSWFSISEPHFSEECFTPFLVCLATTAGLRLSIGHLTLQDSVYQLHHCLVFL